MRWHFRYPASTVNIGFLTFQLTECQKSKEAFRGQVKHPQVFVLYSQYLHKKHQFQGLIFSFSYAVHQGSYRYVHSFLVTWRWERLSSHRTLEASFHVSTRRLSYYCTSLIYWLNARLKTRQVPGHLQAFRFITAPYNFSAISWKLCVVRCVAQLHCLIHLSCLDPNIVTVHSSIWIKWFYPTRQLLGRKYRRSKVLHIAPSLELNSSRQKSQQKCKTLWK